MRTPGLALRVVLVAGLVTSGCNSTAADDAPSSTIAKVEECSWCPAPDPPRNSGAPPVSSSPDLMDQLAKAVDGTPFAGISEDQLLSDIGAVCAAWEGATTLEDATAQVSLARSEQLGVSESEPGPPGYSRFLHANADRRCVRDPSA